MARAISRRRSRGTFRGCGSESESYVGATRQLQRRDVRSVWCMMAIGVAACAAPKIPLGDPQAEIAAMLRRSAADWNRGDHVQYGWQALHDRYQAVYFAPGKHRDSLAFEELHVRPLTLDLALATARFALRRGDAVTASGPFTLLLQKRGDRWQIVHDHTSADPKP